MTLDPPAKSEHLSQSRPPGELLAAARGLGGFVIGAILGAILFRLALQSKIYAIIIPGATAGIFCGGFMGRRVGWMGGVCAVLGLVLTLAVEWRLHAFVRDPSLQFFVSQMGNFPTFRLLLFAAGAGLAGWFGMGNDGVAWLGRRERV